MYTKNTDPVLSHLKQKLLPFIGRTVCLLALGAVSLKADQVSTNVNVQQPAYTEVSRGPHSRVMQGFRVWTNAAGATVTNKASYTELCTGMSVLNGNAQWVPASDQIQITAAGAQATNCQSQAYFAANLNSAGAIDLVTPDGQHLTETPLFLSYFDGVSNVLIGELQDTIGVLLPSGNQIIYSNAFSGIPADVRYNFSLNGLEQDIIVNAQLPPPSAFGLGPDVWLQVWSEFTAAPVPQIIQLPENGDEWLDFGTIQMGSGRAFSIGTTGDAVPTTKQWQVMDGGRTFLVEQVPLQSIAPQMQNLPPPSSYSPGPGGGTTPIRYRPSRQQILPKRRLARKSSSPIKLAKAGGREQGLVIDFVTLNSTQTNYTFQSDSTYYISNSFNSYGTNTFEGGTVLKFATNGVITITPGGPGTPHVIWKGAPYRPVVCTAKDDDTVGEAITGSTGSPTGYYGTLDLTDASTFTLDGLRVSHAKTAIEFIGMSASLYDAQFVNCQYGLVADGGVTLLVGNALFANVATNISVVAACTVNAENVTFSGSSYLAAGPGSLDGCGLFLTNCLLANVTNVLSGVFQFTNGNYNGLYNTPTNAVFGTTTFTNPSYPFQPVGAGNYYLTADSPFRSVGTNNTDSTLLTNLQQKTTFPPIVFNGGASGTIYTNDLTLYPQAQRESGSAPDLGFGYDPIDYAFSSIFVTNATFTVMPGTVIAALVTNGGTYGLTMGNGGQFLCQGTPTSLCRVINFNTVQEQYTTNFVGEPGWDLLSPNYSGNPPASVIQCRFTDFSVLAQDAIFLNDSCNCNDTGIINFQDCQFHGGIISILDSTVNLTNCLLERVYSQLDSEDGNLPVIRNNLFYGGTFEFSPSVTNAIVQDNAFYQTAIPSDLTGYGYNGGFNAFLTNCDRMLPTNATDLVLTNISFQTGPLGYYYYPTSSPLINADTNTTADQVGLYHYTTTTNQVKETNSFLDIGYHYVALGTNGLPVDTTGCGTPDYLRDANGNGLVDSGELSWTNAADLGLNVIITRPANNSVIP